MTTIKLGQYGKSMGYFEDYQEFDPAAEKLMRVYEDLCERCLWVSRNALSNDRCRKEAICYMAGVKALQMVLKMHTVDDPDEKPDWYHLKHYASEVSKLNFLPAE